MIGSKRIAEDLCKQISQENIIASLTEAPEHVSAATVRAAIIMQNSALWEQIEAHRAGGSE